MKSPKKKVAAEKDDDNLRAELDSLLPGRSRTRSERDSRAEGIPYDLALLAGRARELSRGPSGDTWHAAARALDAIGQALLIGQSRKKKEIAAALSGAAESVNVAAGRPQVGSFPRGRSHRGAFARALSVRFAEAIKGRALRNDLDPIALARLLAILTTAENATIVFPTFAGKDHEAIVNLHVTAMTNVLDRDGKRATLAKRAALVRQRCRRIEGACGDGIKGELCEACIALDEESLEVAKTMIGACARRAGVKQPSRLFASADRK